MFEQSTTGATVKARSMHGRLASSVRGAAALAVGVVVAMGALSSANAEDGVIVFGNAEPPTANYWDPSAGFGLVDEQVASLVHDTLLAYDENGVLQPSLATSWERQSATTISATLREGVLFHDGSTLTAEDIKASYDRLGLGELAQSMVVTPGIVVNIVSATEIEIVSPQDFGPLESAMAFVKILPSENIDNPDNFKEGAIGSGPYKFVSYSGNDVVLEANADYWGGAPNIDGVIFRYIEDAQARINALLDGQVDILTRVSSEDISRVADNDAFSIATQTPPAQIIAILQHNGPFGDVRVRQAAAYAIDRAAIAEHILGGLHPVAQSGIPTGAPFYTPLEPAFEYNPDRARELMAEAGFEDGVDITMSTSTLVPNQLEIDQAIAASLGQVGFRVDMERLEVGAFRSSYNQYDISLNTLASFNNDPDFIMGLYTGGAGEAIWHYSDETFHRLERCATRRQRRRARGSGD